VALKTFAIDALNGLDEIHRNNVIHCDIKPHNLLVFKSDLEDTGESELNASFDSFDSNMILKITDFGLSHIIPLGSEKTHMKQKCGTYAYLAPEIANVTVIINIRMYILINLLIFGHLEFVCIRWPLLTCPLLLSNISMDLDLYLLEMQIGGIMNSIR
jgi:serine/threonine protein kinase